MGKSVHVGKTTLARCVIGALTGWVSLCVLLFAIATLTSMGVLAEAALQWSVFAATFAGGFIGGCVSGRRNNGFTLGSGIVTGGVGILMFLVLSALSGEQKCSFGILPAVGFVLGSIIGGGVCRRNTKRIHKHR